MVLMEEEGIEDTLSPNRHYRENKSSPAQDGIHHKLLLTTSRALPISEGKRQALHQIQLCTADGQHATPVQGEVGGVRHYIIGKSLTVSNFIYKMANI